MKNDYLVCSKRQGTIIQSPLISVITNFHFQMKIFYLYLYVFSEEKDIL